jgi:hypothetical protein
MHLDDGDRARLAHIERQLAGDDPKLARALEAWRPSRERPPRVVWLLLATGALFGVLAVLLTSVNWMLLAVVTAGGGWYWRRKVVSAAEEEEEARPRREDAR